MARTTQAPDHEHDEESLAATLERLGGRALQAPELERLLAVVLRVCDAAASARARGLVHRDLDPRHVMIGSAGEVRVIDGDPTLGSPRYMSPEQAWGRGRDLDARTDVYGVGGILYAILTLTAPHHGGSASSDLASARSGTVCAPQQACPERPLPAGLCRIASRALSSDPAARHPSIEILKHDIERFLRGRPRPQEVALA